MCGLFIAFLRSSSNCCYLRYCLRSVEPSVCVMTNSPLKFSFNRKGGRFSRNSKTLTKDVKRMLNLSYGATKL